MKKGLILFCTSLFVIGIICFYSSKAHASDYQGEENRGSVFQVLGDLITGNYKIDKKPIEEKGWFQVAADEVNKMKFSSEEKSR